MIDSETEEMLQSFVTEVYDSLDTNEPFVELLSVAGNDEAVNAIFRVFHTIKGLSGFYGLTVINKVAHEAETLLDIVRKQHLVQSEETVTVIYQVFDLMRAMMQDVETSQSDKKNEEDADNMILIIRDTVETVKRKSENDSPDTGVSVRIPEIVANNVHQIVEDKQPNIEPEYSPVSITDTTNVDTSISNNLAEEELDLPDVSSLISDDMLEQYLTGAHDLIEIVDKNLINLENEPTNQVLIGETFGAIHSLKGNSGFMGFAEIEEISSEIETVLDCVRNKALDIDQNIITILLSNTEMIRKRIDSLEQNDKNDDSKHSEVVQASIPAPSPQAVDPIVEAPKNAPVVTIQKNDNLIVEEHYEVHHEESHEKSTSVAPVHSNTETPAEHHDRNLQMPHQQKKDIRVDTNKIDRLFDMVGELITTEAMVTHNPDLKGLEIPNFNKVAGQLNKITREIQEISMAIRMMPLESLFNKMKRLARDVSIKMKKHVDLQIFGEQTEMDKNVIDEVADPLMHIIRNSIDHGIEDTDKRLERGKPESGKVILGAKYEGNEILISVEDDGNGIDRSAVLQKAYEKGLIDSPDSNLPDKDVFAFIFQPGFSTAKKVTDISGRGVGMDVVRKNIEKLHGSIDVDSEYGKGTKMTFHIPLTLAVMESMAIRVASCYFALPILSLTESFRPRPDMISHTMDGLEVVKIRKEVLPVIRLHEIFGIKDAFHSLTDGILLVIESKGRKTCLFADEIVGQQQAVVKSLSNYIGKVRGITGCMVMSDGSIGLILDIDGLFDLAQNTYPRMLEAKL